MTSLSRLKAQRVQEAHVAQQDKLGSVEGSSVSCYVYWSWHCDVGEMLSVKPSAHILTAVN